MKNQIYTKEGIELSDILKTQHQSSNLPYNLTIKQASEFVNNSEEFWRKKVFKRQIPFIRIGTSVRIPISVVLELIKIVLPLKQYISTKKLEVPDSNPSETTRLQNGKTGRG